MEFTIAWIRRDMRLHDHAVLAAAMSRPHTVQPVFVFDAEILKRFSHKHDRRLSFLAETLCDMHRKLQAKGGGMLVLHGHATTDIPKLSHALDGACIIAAEDCEPAAKARDASVARAVGNRAGQAGFTHVLDHLLMHPLKAMKDDGTPFRVYTPFYKSLMGKLTPLDYASFDVHDAGRYAAYGDVVARAEKNALKVLKIEQGPEAMLKAMGYVYVKDKLWQPTEAESRLASFTTHKIKAYKDNRDRMDIEGTSALSPYLRFGLISVRECMRRAMAFTGIGSETWVKELIWREFYAHILYHFPDVIEHEFQHQYREVKWSRDTQKLEAFCAGKTGFPVVDAAMRQLLETGWMHNRARMIVASFASKDLHLDWRLGEEHFAQYLMDYDLASNVGGWQWASSVGTDAQPYFRVFNPLLQSKKFDPEGHYIRRYVPELAGLTGADVHAPAGLLRPRDYPAPMVNHAEAKDIAIAMFKRNA